MTQAPIDLESLLACGVVFRSTADPEAVAYLHHFFDLEDTMMANGTIGSDFTVITAIRD